MLPWWRNNKLTHCCPNALAQPATKPPPPPQQIRPRTSAHPITTSLRLAYGCQTLSPQLGHNSHDSRTVRLRLAYYEATADPWRTYYWFRLGTTHFVPVAYVWLAASWPVG